MFELLMGLGDGVPKFMAFSQYFLHVINPCLYSAFCICISIDLKCIDFNIAFMDCMHSK